MRPRHVRVGLSRRRRPGPRLDLGRFTDRSRPPGPQPGRYRRGRRARGPAGRHGALCGVAGRMLSDMTTPGAGSSPLAVAALGLVQGGATVADLERRFSENGADLRPGIVEDLLSELESLGLVRIARGTPAREYVLSSLGRRLVENGAWTDAAVSMKDLERMRTDFLSVIAHELRTPITVMRTLTGLLLDPASDPTAEQRRTMLESMERNAERMQHVISEILDLARYRAGTIGLQLRPFDAT